MALNNFNYQLTWSDFRSVSIAPDFADEYAQIHPDLTFTNFQLTRNRRALNITSVDVTIRLIPEDCWAVSAHQNADLLKHEQGHYDILAISAREFYNRLMSLSAANSDALQVRVNALFQQFQQTANDVDDRYDTLTNHSINVSVQQTWDQRIAAVKANPRGTLRDLP
ncbi:MAG: DUF922 domain-containing protein [Chitinophagaceae bacterium]|nr:DUF922 domain-containing protein [Chitinophagaceae bacterium]